MVYIVLSDNEIMTVCGNVETAKWEKELYERNGYKNLEIKDCSVVTYEEDFYNEQIKEG